MSDKGRNKLWPIDRILRAEHPPGMRDGTDVTIELICGFEIFNTRPYHNYETWSNGWRITGTTEDGRKIRVTSEDLDDAVAKYVKARKEPESWQVVK